jgi:hypothetical protein
MVVDVLAELLSARDDQERFPQFHALDDRAHARVADDGIRLPQALVEGLSLQIDDPIHVMGHVTSTADLREYFLLERIRASQVVDRPHQTIEGEFRADGE